VILRAIRLYVAAIILFSATTDFPSAASAEAVNNPSLLSGQRAFTKGPSSLLTMAACAMQPRGLVAWYRGENNALDEIGNATDYKGFNGTFSTGMVGAAFSFAGQDQLFYIDNEANPEKAAASAVSIAAWVRPEHLPGRQVIISRYIWGQGHAWELAIENGKLSFDVHQTDSIKRTAVTNGPVIAAGVFQHVAVTFHLVDQQIRFFVNGAPAQASETESGHLRSINSFFTTDNVGARTDLFGSLPGDTFRGQIDEVQVFNNRLGGGDIASIFGSGIMGLCPNPVKSGRVYTFGDAPLDDVPLTTIDGLKSVRTDSDGYYLARQGAGESYIPRISTHVFAQPDGPIILGRQAGGANDFFGFLSNDNFREAYVLEGDSGEVEGITIGATRENGEPDHTGTLSVNSVWYRWRAPRGGSFTFTLGGSRFNTLLAVYTGSSVSALTKITANDDIGPSASSRVSFHAVAGTEYFVAVDGRMGWAGAGHFRLAYHPDDFAPGLRLSGHVTKNGNSIPGVSITAKTTTGRVANTTLTDAEGRYSFFLPLGIASVKLTVYGQEKIPLGFAEFSGITQDQVIDFAQTLRGQPGYVLISQIVGLQNALGLTVSYSGPGVVGDVPCAIGSAGTSGDSFTCAGITPYSTLTITPRHPTAKFVPSSTTINNISANIVGGLFLANPGSSRTISGKATKDGVPLPGVLVFLDLDLAKLTSVRTDTEGNYRFENLPSGRIYSVHAAMAGHELAQTYRYPDLQTDEVANFIATSSCSYALSSSKQSFPPEGGYGFVSISTGNTCEWQSSALSPDVTLSSTLAFKGSGTISYHVSPNLGPSRVVYLYAGGKVLRLEQAGLHVIGSFDFDGDGRSDFAVRRPADNVWYFLRTTAGYTGFEYGIVGDLMAPADYDGDGKTDVAVFRPSNGTWYIAGSSVGFYLDSWGQVGDLPVPADFDGDGRADVAVYRPSNGTWYLKRSSAGIQITQFGINGDKPQIGDFDGDGKADLAVVRPSENTWHLLKSSNAFTGFTWGVPGDLSVPADYDGDSKTDPAVFRPSNGTWYIAGSSSGFSIRNWGANGDLPVVADYDGDGKADLAVFRPSNNTWYISASRDGMRVTQFGANADVPVHSAFNY
jgi:hypothetical protein